MRIARGSLFRKNLNVMNLNSKKRRRRKNAWIVTSLISLRMRNLVLIIYVARLRMIRLSLS
jgi:hypothetical protein